MDYKKIFEKFESGAGNSGTGRDADGAKGGAEKTFIKTTKKPAIDGSQKAALNRKGNILFNSGDIEGAKRIFLTTGYSDGLSRIGDAYKAQNRYLDALAMYQKAPHPQKFEAMVTQLSAIIKNLIHEEDPSK
ncbi:MAG: hypothetical protein LBD24_05575 [Spirochaetaceae bacterium]|jgi:tetratricopeptide (TPR) repeat protein|nr:hypothetical protein [Spirochaetaceae bacterium]